MSTPRTTTRTLTTLLLGAALAATAHAQLACTKIGFAPGTPDPNRCVAVVDLDRTPAAPSTLAQANRHADAGDARTLQTATTHADAGDAHTLEAAAQHTAQRIADADQRLSAGIAQAAALVYIEPWANRQTTVNVGAASYGGQTALGVTLAHQFGRTTFSAGAATSGSSRTLVRASLGWRF